MADWTTNKDLIQKLYIAFYGRPADPGGLRYWAQQLPDNAKLTDDATKELIGRFVDSPEAQSRFGSPSIEATVDRIYSQAFGRDAIETEKASFAGKTVVDVLVSVLGVSSGRDAEALSNKLDYANMFVETLDPNGNFEPDEAPGGGFAATFVGNHDANAIAAKMLFITADTPATESAVVNDVKYIANDGDPILSEPPPAFTLTASAAAVNEGSSVTFSIANGDADTEYIIRLSGVQDADIDGGLFRTVTTNEAGNASIAVNVVADHTTEGPETLTASVVGKALTASVVINDISLDNVAPVTAAVEAPAAQEGGPPVTGQLLATDSNVGDTLTYTVEALPGLTVNPTTGIFTFDPTENGEVNALTYNSDPWVKTVNYTVTDSGGLASTNSLTLTATPVPLSFTFSADKTSAEEGARTVYTVTASEALASAQEVTFTLIPGNGLGANAGTDNTNMADFTGVGVFNPKTVTIAAGEKTATFDVIALKDGINELPEKYSVSAEINGYGTFTLDGTVVDAVGGGQTFTLTAGIDGAPYFIGTANSDEFYAPLSQNAFAGGVSNTLSSADTLDGGGGTDHLYAELVPEFFGATGGNQVDVQPRTVRIENVEFEARDLGLSFTNMINNGATITVDAKYMWGVERIGSTYSDGDLVIENLTTLANDGSTKRNTDAITITMDHTDNFNTDGDASDLKVLFDDNYLLSGQTREAQAFFFLLDEDADLAGKTNRLDHINVDGIRFSLDGGATILDLDDSAAQLAGTHQGFVNELQDELQALIDEGKVPAGTTLTLDPTITDVTYLDNGELSKPIPAIVLTIGDGTPVTPIGYSQVEDAIGEYDVYGRFSAESEVADDPITSNIELHKVGRGGEGGDLIIGGKSLHEGVEVFNVAVLGDDSKPSNLGTLGSTGDDLRVVNIATHADYADGESFASLTIRDGFGEYDDLQLVNADAFLGDLTLGSETRVYNLDTLTAQGGGDVSFYGELTGAEENQAYSYTTGAGDDLIDLLIRGDAVDFAGSSVNVSTGAGKDTVVIDNKFVPYPGSDQTLNQVVLKNITVDTGADDDVVLLNVSGRSAGDVRINTGAGNDFIDTAAFAGSDFAGNDFIDTAAFAGSDFAGNDLIDDVDGTVNAVWAFNYDDIRLPDPLNAGDLPGVQTSLAYLGGATVTVTFSGAGVKDVAAGGGVMSGAGAAARTNGYEKTVTIGSLVNGNQYFGDQRDINNAVLKAINDDPVLGQLLEASIAENNTLKVESLVGGDFDATDLEITLTQKLATNATHYNAVLAEAKSVFHNSQLTLEQLWGAGTPAAGDKYVGADDGAGVIDSNSGAVDLNDYYTGLGTDNAALYALGEASTREVDNIINAGEGNDIIVLSTDAVTNFPQPVQTVGPNNALLNGGSNETIVLQGNFGNDVVMNFTSDVATQGDPTEQGGAMLPVNTGLDFLDFTSYLTGKQSASGSTQSQVPIPVTLQYNLAAPLTDPVDANEVVIARLLTAGTETFGGLTAAVIQSIFNTTAIYGGLTGGKANDEYDTTSTPGDLDIDLVNGAAKAIFMVENDRNLGEYKVFELSWNGSASADADGDPDGVVTATQVGTLDFGASLEGMTEIVLVGSDAHTALLTDGWAATFPVAP